MSKGFKQVGRWALIAILVVGGGYAIRIGYCWMANQPTQIAIAVFSGSLAIIGVLVGAFLGEGLRIWRGARRVKNLRNLIFDELRSIRAMIPQKQDILEQMKTAAQNENVLPGGGVPILSTGYDEYFAELYEHLSRRHRNCLHVIYGKLKNADEFLISYDSACVTAIRDGLINDPWRVFYGRLSDYSDLYLDVLKLIDSYLCGNPKDVFPSKGQATPI